MVFNSYTFAGFFLVVLLAYGLPLSWISRKGGLLLASYLFYAAWSPPFVLLLWFSTVVDWHVARRLSQSRREFTRRMWLLLSLAVNLGLLGFFKYGEFLAESLRDLGIGLGGGFTEPSWNIVLPVGISFYTFQTLSYSIDVYRRRCAPWHSFLDYALYVSFFPQLVAGPIVRAEQFLPQCREPPRRDLAAWSGGAARLLTGLFQKCVLADGIFAPTADGLFAAELPPGTPSAWCGMLAFSGQIYCDFAGYTNCALGTALCLGFRLPENFRSPYAALGFSDFWQRWHISLSTWLRDYLYIPLGGNRHGRWRTVRNLMVTMLLGGLWHGAAWTFVAWGACHGLFLMAEHLIRAAAWPWRWQPNKMTRGGLRLMTFLFVTLAWILFRAEDFGQALAIFTALIPTENKGPVWNMADTQMLISLMCMLALCVTQWRTRDRARHEIWAQLAWWKQALIVTGMLVLLVTASGEDRAFIYFQF